MKTTAMKIIQTKFHSLNQHQHLYGAKKNDIISKMKNKPKESVCFFRHCHYTHGLYQYNTNNHQKTETFDGFYFQSIKLNVEREK